MKFRVLSRYVGVASLTAVSFFTAREAEAWARYSKSVTTVMSLKMRAADA